MNTLLTVLVIQGFINALFLLAGYLLGKHVANKRRDEIDHSFKVADMLFDQRARHAEGANVIEFPRGAA